MSGVPFMLTNVMKDALRSRGLTDDEIEQITPAEAQKILLTPDARAVREFIHAIAAQARAALGANISPGLLQLTRLHPTSESLVPSRFELDDVDRMVSTAVGDCEAGHNVYIEGRTVPTSLRGSCPRHRQRCR